MAAALFRLIQGEVGALVQIIGPAFAIRDHDPDAGVDINLRIVDLIGLADLLPDNIGPLERHLFGQIVREHRELIAAETIQRLRGFTEKERRLARSCSSLSPASCPRVSFTSLKLSRSKSITTAQPL